MGYKLPPAKKVAFLQAARTLRVSGTLRLTKTFSAIFHLRVVSKWDVGGRTVDEASVGSWQTLTWSFETCVICRLLLTLCLQKLPPLPSVDWWICLGEWRTTVCALHEVLGQVESEHAIHTIQETTPLAFVPSSGVPGSGTLV